MSPGLRPQVYPLDRVDADPGDSRSDHAAFQAINVPSCLVAEDFFRELCSPTRPCTNDWYHTVNDREIDDAYAAAIARAVIAATWRLANA